MRRWRGALNILIYTWSLNVLRNETMNDQRKRHVPNAQSVTIYIAVYHRRLGVESGNRLNRSPTFWSPLSKYCSLTQSCAGRSTVLGTGGRIPTASKWLWGPQPQNLPLNEIAQVARKAYKLT